MAEFDFGKQCAFCGASTVGMPRGYAGEPCCGVCGKGGNGEPDERRMAYKGNLLPDSAEPKGNERHHG